MSMKLAVFCKMLHDTRYTVKILINIKKARLNIFSHNIGNSGSSYNLK